MSRIDYDLFCQAHPEFNLPCYTLLWESDRQKIRIMSPETLFRNLAAQTLVGRSRWNDTPGRHRSIFDPS